MQGRNVIWLPGTDHAGIATQKRREKQLMAEALLGIPWTRTLHRARLQWKTTFGNTIVSQPKQLGESCDWTVSVHDG